MIVVSAGSVVAVSVLTGVNGAVRGASVSGVPGEAATAKVTGVA